MRNASDLKRELDRINGRGYKSYKDLEGQYKFNNYILSIDHVQGDPFASPSRVRVIVKIRLINFQGNCLMRNIRKLHYAIFWLDYLAKIYINMWKNIWFR